ncbi:MAG: MFS transporter [Oscillospiraceae bacterium]|nr:MFS transporter [Oscillospiraceae bacterium]
MGAITQNKQGLKTLIAGTVLQLFLGIIYVWSVFKNPVSLYYGWEPSDVGLTASFMLCFFVIGILSGGKLQMKIGVKFTALIGGLMVAVGMLATALIPQGELLGFIDPETPFSSYLEVTLVPIVPVFLIYIFYGIIGGFGVGMGYNAAISTAQKWFPQNRGLATGISVCAFGASTVVFAPVVELLNGKFEVNVTLMILSGVFAAATLLLFSFIKAPVDLPAPAIKAGELPPAARRQYTTFEMLGSPRFYLIALSLMLGTSVFFIINPDLYDLAKDRGLESFATYLVMFTGIANAAGRLGAPLMSDKIGREQADIIILTATALGAFGLCFAQGGLLVAIIAVVAFCFGGYSGLYPVLTSENFGIKNIGSNYGAVMVGFMISALLFPVVINKIEEQILRFITLGCLAVIGAILVVVLKIVNSKKVKDNKI